MSQQPPVFAPAGDPANDTNDEVLTLTDADLSADPAKGSPRGLIALLLDPRGLQTLMSAGGGLLAIGLVVWLAAIGVFDNPLHMALALGLGNIVVLAAGVLTVMRTRYQMAGRGVAMLACLLLPLHLWFYDAQGLITLAKGGHLWIPALGCCMIYVGVARLLKDALFVYPAVAGVVLSGLLLLADAHIERFWEVLAPATLMVVIGALCVHVRQLFPSTSEHDSTAYTRENFGHAFFVAGHTALAAGLLLLLGGRIAGFLWEPWFAELDWFEKPYLAEHRRVQLAALALTGLSTYVYGFSAWVVRAGRRFAVVAAATLFWTFLLAVDVLGISVTEQLCVGLLALVSIAVQVVRGLVVDKQQGHKDSHALTTMLGRCGIATAWLATLWLTTQVVRGLHAEQFQIDAFEFDWTLVMSAIVTVLAHGLGVVFKRVACQNHTASLVGLATTTTLALVAFVAAWPTDAVVPVVLCIATVVMFGLLGFAASVDGLRRDAAMRAAEVVAGLLFVLVLPVLLTTYAASLVLLFALLATGYMAVAMLRSTHYAVSTAVALASVACWQAVVVYELGVYLPLALLSAAGLAVVIVDRLRLLGEGWLAGRLALIVGNAGGGLLAVNRLLAGEADASLLLLVMGQTVAALVAAWLSTPARGRRALLCISLFSFVVSLMTLNAVSQLSVLQRSEMIATLAGCVLLVVAHVSWRSPKMADDPDQDLIVDGGLWIGTALAVLPMTIGLLSVRMLGSDWLWTALHEAGVLALGLALVASGLLCRFRATTLGGVAMLASYILSLVLLIDVPDQLQTTAVYLMVGGGVVFGSALVLSIYRDRLLSLPQRIRDGDGVFAVLKWR